MEWILATSLLILFVTTILKELKFFEQSWSQFPFLFHFIPSWSFFAPNPYHSDYYILFRTIENQEVKEWKQAYHISKMRKKHAFLWNPQKWQLKSIADVSIDLLKIASFTKEKNSICLSLTSLESLFARNVFSSKGLLSWQVARSVTGWTARGKILPFLYHEKFFPIYSILSLVLSLFIFIMSCLKILSPPLLMLEWALLIILLFRAHYGLDGAYHMNLVVLGSISLISICGVDSNGAKFCLWFIAAQLILAYFIAGIRKLQSPAWQNGKAIEMIFQTEAYGHPFIHRLSKIPVIRLLLSWSVILFETLFPLVLILNQKFVVIFLVIAFIFHLMNAIFMGLNNFLFAFISAYPILFYVVAAQELVLPLLFYLVVPIVFIAWIWSQKPSSIWLWLLNTASVGAYLTNLFLTGVWPFFGIPVIAGIFFLGFFALALGKSLFYFISTKSPAPPRKKVLFILGYTLLLMLSSLSSWEIVSYLKGKIPSEHTINLDFPLRNGTYYILHGGNHPFINGHYEVIGQRFALDIVKLNKLDIRSNQFIPSQLTDYCIFSENLYSPLSGTIIEAIDSIDDSPTSHLDPINPAGNHLIIQTSNRAVVLAHLLKGSLKVAIGDHVEAGQLLAQVGNSGNTSEPHLHIHAVEMNDNKDYLFEAKPISMIFNGKFLVRNNRYTSP